MTEKMGRSSLGWPGADRLTPTLRMKRRREEWALPAAGGHPEIQLRKLGWSGGVGHPLHSLQKLESAASELSKAFLWAG